MGFNNPNKPKILKTRLSTELHHKFKILAAQKKISMADYIEKLIKEEVKGNVPTSNIYTYENPSIDRKWIFSSNQE